MSRAGAISRGIMQITKEVNNMKKYIYEVGIGIQTVYIFPEANDAKEAQKLAEEQFEKLSQDWQDFDLDYCADFVQIHCMTETYKNLLNSPAKEYSDGEVLDFLMDIADVDTVKDLEEILRHTLGLPKGKEMGND